VLIAGVSFWILSDGLLKLGPGLSVTLLFKIEYAQVVIQYIGWIVSHIFCPSEGMLEFTLCLAKLANH